MLDASILPSFSKRFEIISSRLLLLFSLRTDGELACFCRRLCTAHSYLLVLTVYAATESTAAHRTRDGERARTIAFCNIIQQQCNMDVEESESTELYGMRYVETKRNRWLRPANQLYRNVHSKRTHIAKFFRFVTARYIRKRLHRRHHFLIQTFNIIAIIIKHLHTNFHFDIAAFPFIHIHQVYKTIFLLKTSIASKLF